MRHRGDLVMPHDGMIFKFLWLWNYTHWDLVVGKPSINFCDCEIKRIGIWGLGSPQLIFVIVKLHALAFGGWEALKINFCDCEIKPARMKWTPFTTSNPRCTLELFSVGDVLILSTKGFITVKYHHLRTIFGPYFQPARICKSQVLVIANYHYTIEIWWIC